MNNAPMNIDSIRQPNPNVVGAKDASSNQPAKTFNYPKVGVADVPTLSKTPLADTLVIKEQQNPKPKLQLPKKSNRGFNVQNLLSFTIFGCSIGALLMLLKKK